MGTSPESSPRTFNVLINFSLREERKKKRKEIEKKKWISIDGDDDDFCGCIFQYRLPRLPWRFPLAPNGTVRLLELLDVRYGLLQLVKDQDVPVVKLT